MARNRCRGTDKSATTSRSSASLATGSTQWSWTNVQQLSIRSGCAVFPYPANSNYLIKMTALEDYKSFDISVFFKSCNFLRGKMNNVNHKDLLTISFVVSPDIKINLSELQVYFNINREDI